MVWVITVSPVKNWIIEGIIKLHWVYSNKPLLKNTINHEKECIDKQVENLQRQFSVFFSFFFFWLNFTLNNCRFICICIKLNREILYTFSLKETSWKIIENIITRKLTRIQSTNCIEMFPVLLVLIYVYVIYFYTVLSCIGSWIHHHSQDTLSLTRGFPCYPKIIATPFLLPLDFHNLLSISMISCQMSHKWNHTICHILGLLFFTQYISFEIHPSCYVSQ